MATPSHTRALVSSVNRLKLSLSIAPATRPQSRHIQQSSRPAASFAPPASSSLEHEFASLRLPKAVQATYLNPLKHAKSSRSRANKPSCQLHLRSYSVRNLELFADFALRAAYFLRLVASGAAPLPRKTERWTVPRSNFVHKKSQENFERITLKRKITIVRGHPDTVAVWLAFLRRHQYYGVGIKANVWEYGGLNAVEDMDREAERLGEILGRRKFLPEPVKRERMHGPVNHTSVLDESFKAQWGAYSALGGTPTVEHAGQRIDMVKLSPPIQANGLPSQEESVGYSRARGHAKAVYMKKRSIERPS